MGFTLFTKLYLEVEVIHFFLRVGSICTSSILLICLSTDVSAQSLQDRYKSQQHYQQLQNELELKEKEAIRKSQTQDLYDCGFWGKLSFVDGLVIWARESSLGKFVVKNGSYGFSWSKLDNYDNSRMIEEFEFNPQTKMIYVVRRHSNPRRDSGEVLADKCKQIGG